MSIDTDQDFIKPVIEQRLDWSLLKRLFLFLLLATAILSRTFDRGDRLFLPLLALSYGIAACVYLYERRGGQERPDLIRYLFSKDIWLHPSAINDYVIATGNAILAATIVQYITSNFVLLRLSIFHIFKILHLRQSTDAPGIGVLALYTVCAFMTIDLMAYIVHRLTHQIPALWEFHKVHHSAEVMTPVTLHRSHPVDAWLNAMFKSFGFALSSGVFLYFYPNIHGVMSVAGVDAGLLFSCVLGANLNHSHIWLRYGRHAEHIFCSPAQHQIHHSTAPKHYNKNYAPVFAFWDWVFGTLYIPQGRENITFGLGNSEQKHFVRLRDIYFRPVRRFLKRVFS